MPRSPEPSSTNDSGSGTPDVAPFTKVLETFPMVAVPFVPDVTLMSFDTEIEVAGAKKTTELKIEDGGPGMFGLVTII